MSPMNWYMSCIEITIPPSLVVVLASGVYFSSFIKDLVCSPRPFSPPVSRLST